MRPDIFSALVRLNNPLDIFCVESQTSCIRNYCQRGRGGGGSGWVGQKFGTPPLYNYGLGAWVCSLGPPLS